MIKVVWFKNAIRDLEKVKDYISQYDPQAAQKVVQKIKSTVSLLSEQPSIGRPGRVPNTKELIINQVPFILPYRVRDNKIEILRVLHTSRQWPNKI